VCVWGYISYIYEAPRAGGESIWGHFSRLGRPINLCRNQSSRTVGGSGKGSKEQ
jgi:hypothetical protein